jgi:DNA-binding NarL/FixJ family response regulator
VKQIVISFGILITALIVLFRIAGMYHFSSYDSQIWTGVFSLLFLAIGIVLSRKLFTRTRVVKRPAPLTINPEGLSRAGISKREAEILLLINDGLSNQQIADKLFISESTVKKHISNIFQKLSVERRTEALKKAQELSIIP